MKVFLSWSGDLSHKVALVFRDWLPSVIQEIVPYVSSEDIDKGARWSTDIATELEDSTFGVLCVTKANLPAPWLNFEAGALSKILDKSYVVPFLFDIKRSEVNGPILQFQSTINEKEDIRKLLITLNRATDAKALSEDRLNKAFDVWYPTLQEQLALLNSTEEANEPLAIEEKGVSDLLEEILELTRSNQKLIRNPEGSLSAHLTQITKQLTEVIERQHHSAVPRRSAERFDPEFAHHLMAQVAHGTNELRAGTRIRIISSLLKDTMPWLYEMAIEVDIVLSSRRSHSQKLEMLQMFRAFTMNALEFSEYRSRRRNPMTGEMIYLLERIIGEEIEKLPPD